MPTEEYSEDNPQQFQTARSYTIVYTNPAVPDKVTLYNVPTTPYKWSDHVTKGVNPHWRRAIRENRQAATNLSGSRQTRSVVNPSYVYVVQKIPSTTKAFIYEGLYTASAPPSSASFPEAEANNEAASRFLKKLLNERRSIMGGVALGELGETLRMLRHPAKGLRKGIDDWSKLARKLVRQKRKRYRTPRQAAEALRRNLSNGWLEKVYGWGPLINDIGDAGRAINKWNYYDVGRAVIFGVGVASGPVSYSRGTTALSGVNMITEIDTSCTSTVKYLGATRAVVRNPVRFRQDLLGFSWQDFAPTVWELIPYSFLVDYFTNISDIINGWSYGRAGLAWSLKTVHNDIVLKRTWIYVPKTTQYYLKSHSSGLYIAENKTVSRIPYTGTFVPDVSFRIPGLGTRWINIAALAGARYYR